MEPELYESLRDLEATNWWFVGMRSIARSLLGDGVRAARALDVGCGPGGNLDLLARVADEVVAIDRSPRALAYARGRMGDGRILCADAGALPVRDASFDLVFLFNVIEHLADDVGALREAARVLTPGGVVLVATSASMTLWGDHDVANHHHRRYSKRALARALEDAGLAVRRLTHANLALYAPAAVVAAAQRLRARLVGRPRWTRNPVEVHPMLDAALRAMLEAEARVLSRRDLPFGVSLFARAERT